MIRTRGLCDANAAICQLIYEPIQILFNSIKHLKTYAHIVYFVNKMQINLQSHEIILLKSLEDGRQRTIDELAAALKTDQSAIVRASLTLKKYELAEVSESETYIAKLTKEGETALKNGLPEKQLIREIIKIGPEAKLELIKFGSKNIAIGYAKRKGYISMNKTGRGIIIAITPKGHDSLKTPTPEELLLKRAVTTRKVTRKELELLKSRKLINYTSKTIRTIKSTPKGAELASHIKIKKQVSRLTPDLIKTGRWNSVALRKYNTTAPVSPVYPGKRHFVNQATDYVRKIWLEMGFKEMTGPIIQTSFWNFDALFVPQDHPARDIQDTFFMDLKSENPRKDKKLVEKVKKAHEEGVCNSSGWQYKWSHETARKVVLRTHTTVLSAQTLAQLKKDELPAKYFAIGRCFRNEALDWKHLFEFNQVEGIVVDKNANFRHLLGYLKEFFKKLGFERARFRPAYFPYTEMSVEIEVYYPKRDAWIELGGAGIFRPEVVEPLLGEPIPVLAWGPGFDRIIMDYYKIKDIRDLYKNDIKQLREMKQWMIG